MKRLFATTFSAAVLTIGAFGGVPSAGAATADGDVAGTTREAETTFTVYSAMTDILSCKYYPTRPWC